MMHANWLKGIGAAALFIVASAASAETISIADKLNNGAVVPQRGMSMATVENRFGSPNTRNLAVGEPPITRWHYDNFRVYFEHEYVIHAVAVN
ncbi:MAG: hypothetical protein AAF434_10500 [Pseudomonadota bacterium]